MKKICFTILMLSCMFFSATLFATKTKTRALVTHAENTSHANPQIPLITNIYTEDKLNITASKEKPYFMLKLKSNPTTGYAWYLRDYNNRLLEPISHSFEAPDPKTMGAPGFELWTFRVLPAGFTFPQQATLRLVYARAWQQNDNASDLVYRVTISAS